MNKKKEQSGFTLIEILVVIGIIAILAVIVLIAINPGRQFAQSRNTQRTSNVNAILNAVGQRMADNKGKFIDTGACTTDIPVVNPVPKPLLATTGVKIADNNPNVGDFDLAPCLVSTYITALPFDPNNATAKWEDKTNYDTGYRFFKDIDGRVTVFAPDAELGESISITR